MNKIPDAFIYQIPLLRSEKNKLKKVENDTLSTNSKNEFSVGLYFSSIILKKDFKIFQPEYFFSTNGKTFLKSRDFGFSITYTDEYIFIAIVKDIDIGIDAEKIKNNNLEVGKEFMSLGELVALDTSNDKQGYFLRLWTLKESYLKLVGHGIDDTITKLEFKENQDGTFSVERDGVDVLNIKNFLLKSCIITVATFNEVNCKFVEFQNTEQFLEKYEN